MGNQGKQYVPSPHALTPALRRCAELVEAEAEVPRAMATALREGKLGVMDYYNLQNVVSDTQMRSSIANAGKQDSTPAEQK